MCVMKGRIMCYGIYDNATTENVIQPKFDSYAKKSEKSI